MQKRISLSIPKPCHEDWNNMQPSEQGRFCLSCQKQVVDFTQMSDAELFNFFSKTKEQHVCGRTHTAQLDTVISKPVEPKKKKLWYVQYFSMLLMLLNKPSAQAQVKPPVESKPVDKRRTSMGAVAILPVAQPRVVTGKVTNEKGEPIPGALIVIKDAKTGATCNDSGNFSIRVLPTDILYASALGYDTKLLLIKDQATLSITLQSSQQMWLGELVIINPDAIADDQPRHVANVLVKNKETGRILKNVKLQIYKNSEAEPQTAYTDGSGAYEIRKIKEDDSFLVNVAVEGFEEGGLKISGSGFHKKRENRIIFVQPKIQPIVIEGETNDLSKSIFMGDTVVTRQPMIRPSCATNIRLGAIITGVKVTPTITNFPDIFTRTSVVIYPNPVMSGTNATVQLNGFANGDYQLIVSNVGGQQLSSVAIKVVGKKQSAYVPSSAIKFPGVYIVAFVNTSTNKTATAKLVVQ